MENQKSRLTKSPLWVFIETGAIYYRHPYNSALNAHSRQLYLLNVAGDSHCLIINWGQYVCIFLGVSCPTQTFVVCCLRCVNPWWRHQMETFSTLLALCAGNSPVPGEFPSQRPVTQSFDVFLICAWINDRVNNRNAGDLRRHNAYYDVTVMHDKNWSRKMAFPVWNEIKSEWLSGVYRESDYHFYICLIKYIHCSDVLCFVQSSVFITWSNIVRYCMNNYRNSGRLSIRCWTHKRHPIARPNGRAMGCLLWIFVRKITAI